MASNYRFMEPGAGFPSISNSGTYNTSSGPGAPLAFGLVAGAVDPTYGYGEFMFVAGAAASSPTAGDMCLLQAGTAQQAVSGNTASQGPVGVAVTALSNTNVWGWVQVYGVCDFANMGTQGTAAAGLPVVIGTTAGRVQSTASATGFILNGVKVSQYSTTANSNSALLNLYWPTYDGRNQ